MAISWPYRPGVLRPDNELAIQTFTWQQKAFFLALGLGILLWLMLSYVAEDTPGLGSAVQILLITLNGGLTTFYLAVMIFRVVIQVYSLSAESASIIITDEEIEDADWSKLLSCTLLVCVYREGHVLEELIEHLLVLNFPKDKLQIIICMEECDNNPDDPRSTIPMAMSIKDLPPHFEWCIVPAPTNEPGMYVPQTKPRALNFGLMQARGDIVGIYDAEDEPEPNQVIKNVLAFMKPGGRKIGCIQSQLVIRDKYNFVPDPYQARSWTRSRLVNRILNLPYTLRWCGKQVRKYVVGFFITKCFAAEYDALFNELLPGLSKLDQPIPLGGTSNYFWRDHLTTRMRGWDACNVTEDCALGMQVAQEGLLTETINSYTLEEAPTTLRTRINQQSRWSKGYMQTYLFFMRNPLKLLWQLGPIRFLIFQLVIGGTPFSLLAIPFVWALTALYIFSTSDFIQGSEMFRGTWVAAIPDTIRTMYPGPIYYPALACFVLGNFLFVYQLIIGCFVREKYLSAFIVPVFAPIYWVSVLSRAAYKAAFQLIFDPFKWEHTEHLGQKIKGSSTSPEHFALEVQPI